MVVDTIGHLLCNLIYHLQYVPRGQMRVLKDTEDVNNDWGTNEAVECDNEGWDDV